MPCEETTVEQDGFRTESLAVQSARNCVPSSATDIRERPTRPVALPLPYHGLGRLPRGEIEGSADLFARERAFHGWDSGNGVTCETFGGTPSGVGATT